jgi:hypothetical protein
LADNAANNQTRIATIAKMLMEEPEEATKIANKLKADYILIYVVAQRVSIDNNTYYILGYGGRKILTISNLSSVWRLAEEEIAKRESTRRRNPETPG